MEINSNLFFRKSCFSFLRLEKTRQKKEHKHRRVGSPTERKRQRREFFGRQKKGGKNPVEVLCFPEIRFTKWILGIRLSR